MTNTPGMAACRCESPARCNCCLKSYDPVLLISNVGPGKIAEVYFKEEPAFLWYVLRGCFCQLFDSNLNVLKHLIVEISAQFVMQCKVAVDPL